MGRTSSSIYKRISVYASMTSRDGYVGKHAARGLSEPMKKLKRCDNRAAKRKEENLVLRDLREEWESDAKETEAEKQKLVAEMDTTLYDMYSMYDLDGACPLCFEADCEQDRLCGGVDEFDSDVHYDDQYSSMFD